MAGGGLARILQAVSLGTLLSWIGNKKMRFFIAKTNGRNLRLLKDLLEAGLYLSSTGGTHQTGSPAPALHRLGLSSALGYQAHCRGVHELSEMELFTPTDRSYIAIFVHPLDSVSGMELFAQ